MKACFSMGYFLIKKKTLFQLFLFQARRSDCREEMWAGKTAMGCLLSPALPPYFSRSLASRRSPLSERLEQATFALNIFLSNADKTCFS